jgi:hypothetical protein
MYCLIKNAVVYLPLKVQVPDVEINNLEYLLNIIDLALQW